MNLDEKNKIIEAAKVYLTEKNISQNELKRQTKISYINNMLNGNFQFKNARNNELSDIPDKYFTQLAEFINFIVSVDLWPMVETEQTAVALYEFEQAKFKNYVRVLIGKTGSGKSYLSDKFKQRFPVGTYPVICNDFDTPATLLDKILQSANIQCESKSVPKRLDKLKIEMWREYRNGKKPIIVLDEAENLEIRTMKLFKSLYDYLKDACGLAFIGTPELITKFDKYRKRETLGFEQFYRRIEAGIRYLPEIEPSRSFKPFFENKNLSTDAKKLLIQCSSNYGTLKDYLLPALEEANGGLITADLLKSIHNNLAYTYK